MSPVVGGALVVDRRQSEEGAAVGGGEARARGAHRARHDELGHPTRRHRQAGWCPMAWSTLTVRSVAVRIEQDDRRTGRSAGRGAGHGTDRRQVAVTPIVEGHQGEPPRLETRTDVARELVDLHRRRGGDHRAGLRAVDGEALTFVQRLADVVIAVAVDVDRHLGLVLPGHDQQPRVLEHAEVRRVVCAVGGGAGVARFSPPGA